VTGSTPHRSRRWWGRTPREQEQKALPGSARGAHDDERGREASLEASTTDPDEATTHPPDAAALTPSEPGAPQDPEEGSGPSQVSGPPPAVPRPTAPGAVTSTEDAMPEQPAVVAAAKDRLVAVRDGVRDGVDLARAAIGYLTDRIIEIAPRIPVRDLETLRRQFPGLTPEELADKLVAGAVRGTSTVGAGIGAAAMLPAPPAMPTELAAEVTAVAAIELKLVAELHEVYGRRPAGALGPRSTAYLTSWADERGIDVARPWTVNTAVGSQLKRELRQQITKRLARVLPSLTPFLVGAAVGAVMNRRNTRRLAERIRADLRRHQVTWENIPQLPPLEKPADVLPPEILPETPEILPEDPDED
jgi:hypothetical protein